MDDDKGLKVSSPVLDHKGDPSWTSFIVLVVLLLLVVAFGLLWFAPEWVADRVVEGRTLLRDVFFATVVGYVARRWTATKETPSRPSEGGK